MDAREIIFDYFDGYMTYSEAENDLKSLMGYLDTDTLVAWFCDEGYVDGLDDDDKLKFIEDYYDLHCGR